MFAKPQCPFCGQQFDTVEAVACHLDEQNCSASDLSTRVSTAEPESKDHVIGYADEDPRATAQEDAG